MNPLKIPTKTLYDTDFNFWVEETVNNLKSKNYEQIDWENLIDEVEGLAKRDKRELESRLTTLYEHALKRCFVPLPDCYRGWEGTLSRTQQQLTRILRDSPSLKAYLLAIIDECYHNALKNLCREYDTSFPDICPFPTDLESLLCEEFWQLKN
ncbi:MAG TPA: DUF29 domain-containing protein [Cyanothece sp. UBA12306]|nr:DUF29 domain-containing protein [Cyanothece sp. UBA12306]